MIMSKVIFCLGFGLLLYTVKQIVYIKKLYKEMDVNFYKSKFSDVNKELLVYMHWFYYGESYSYKIVNKWTKDQILDLVIDDLMFDEYSGEDFPDWEEDQIFLKYKGEQNEK